MASGIGMKRFIHVATAFVGMAGIAPPVAAQAPLASQPATRVDPPIPPSTNQEMDRLAVRLGDPSSRERAEAGRRLLEAGGTAYSSLKAAFETTSRYEVRRAIRQVAEEIYVFRSTPRRPGFLGIGIEPWTSARDERVPEGVIWIKVNRVLPGSGAERAGLRLDDLIMELNGRPLDMRGGDFPSWISKFPPRTRVALRVMRGVSELRLEAVLGLREEDQREAEGRFEAWWRREFDPRGEYGAALPSDLDPRWTLETVEPPVEMQPAHDVGEAR